MVVLRIVVWRSVKPGLHTVFNFLLVFSAAATPAALKGLNAFASAPWTRSCIYSSVHMCAALFEERVHEQWPVRVILGPHARELHDLELLSRLHAVNGPR